jgi:hypothetical protein
MPLCEALVRGRKVCIFANSLVKCVEQLKKKANIVTEKVALLSANGFEIEDDDVFLMCCSEKQSFQLQIDSIDNVQSGILAEENPILETAGDSSTKLVGLDDSENSDSGFITEELNQSETSEATAEQINPARNNQSTTCEPFVVKIPVRF